jgi:hypothetical protein
VAQAPSNAPRLAVNGTTVSVRPHLAARQVIWRIGAGRWHGARSRGGVWRVSVAPTDRAGQLTVRVRFRQGGVARFEARLASG